jgi:hypothetical protein
MREPLFYRIAVLGIDGRGEVHQQRNPKHLQKPLCCYRQMRRRHEEARER